RFERVCRDAALGAHSANALHDAQRLVSRRRGHLRAKKRAASVVDENNIGKGAAHVYAESVRRHLSRSCSCSRNDRLRGGTRQRMARPLIDFVQSRDLDAREVGLAGADGTCRAQELSRDDPSGERSMLLDLAPGWRRLADGQLEHDEELFVLSGELNVDDDRLSRYGYVFHPRGGPRPSLQTARGARVLAFLALDARGEQRIDYRRERAVGPLHLAQLDWERPRTPNFP